MILIPSPYTYVSNDMYNIWVQAKTFIPGVKLGGFFANKRGYHNTRWNNQRLWPDDYSIQFNADKEGPADLASGIDLTMSTEQMVKRTEFLRSSALDSKDYRLYQLREFIGTFDGSRVYCRIASDSRGLGNGRGLNDWSRDPTHLWHIHLSTLRKYANKWLDLLPLISVLKGESLELWEAKQDMTPQEMIEYPHKNPKTGYTAKFGDRIIDIQTDLDFVRADLTQSRVREQLTLATLQALATGGSSIDTTVIMELIETKAGQFMAEIESLRKENRELRNRLSTAFQEG